VSSIRVISAVIDTVSTVAVSAAVSNAIAIVGSNRIGVAVLTAVFRVISAGQWWRLVSALPLQLPYLI